MERDPAQEAEAAVDLAAARMATLQMRLRVLNQGARHAEADNLVHVGEAYRAAREAWEEASAALLLLLPKPQA